MVTVIQGLSGEKQKLKDTLKNFDCWRLILSWRPISNIFFYFCNFLLNKLVSFLHLIYTICIEVILMKKNFDILRKYMCILWELLFMFLAESISDLSRLNSCDVYPWPIFHLWKWHHSFLWFIPNDLLLISIISTLEAGSVVTNKSSCWWRSIFKSRGIKEKSALEA